MIDEKRNSDAGDAAGLRCPQYEALLLAINMGSRLSGESPSASVIRWQHELEDLRARVRALEAQLEAGDATLRESQAQNNALRDTVRALEAEVEALNETVTQGAAAYAEARRAIVALEAELLTIRRACLTEAGMQDDGTTGDMVWGCLYAAKKFQRQRDDFAQQLQSLSAQLTALEAERDRLTRERNLYSTELDAYQAREANCCPEDMGFDEVIKHLRAQLAALEAERAALLPLGKLLTRYLDNHCQHADVEGMSTLCECKLCIDTKSALEAMGR